MQHFSQFRLGTHNLMVGFVASQGLCTHCGGIVVANELHMMHACLVLQPLRQQYAAVFTSNTDPVTLTL